MSSRQLLRPESKLQRGAAAVEFALVAPLLLLLILGMIDWGWHMFVSQVMTNAAREGARAGSLWPDDPDQAIADAQQTTINYINSAGLSSGVADIQPSLVASGVGNGVQVSVQYPTGSLTGFLNFSFFGRSGNLIPDFAWAQVEMRRN